MNRRSFVTVFSASTTALLAGCATEPPQTPSYGDASGSVRIDQETSISFSGKFTLDEFAKVFSSREELEQELGDSFSSEVTSFLSQTDFDKHTLVFSTLEVPNSCYELQLTTLDSDSDVSRVSGHVTATNPTPDRICTQAIESQALFTRLSVDTSAVDGGHFDLDWELTDSNGETTIYQFTIPVSK